MTSYGTEYPFGQFGSALLAVSSPNLLPTPSLPAFGVEKGGGRGWIDNLDAVGALFSGSQNTGV